MFSQQRLTSFDPYESAWRTANTGSNPVGATSSNLQKSPAESPAPEFVQSSESARETAMRKAARAT